MIKVECMPIASVGGEELFAIPRDHRYLERFSDFLWRSGFGEDGKICNSVLKAKQSGNKFENETFSLQPEPDFVLEYKPKRIRIFRQNSALYINKDINLPEFHELLDECEKSLDALYGGRIRFTYRPEMKSEAAKAIKDGPISRFAAFETLMMFDLKMKKLDEAIKRAEEVVKEKTYEYHDCMEAHYKEEARECAECAEEHKQLAEWLKDYKRLSEQQEKQIQAADGLPETEGD